LATASAQVCVPLGHSSLYFLYVTLGLPARGGHSSNKYCVTVYGSILMRFSELFQNGQSFQMHYIVLIFVAR